MLLRTSAAPALLLLVLPFTSAWVLPENGTVVAATNDYIFVSKTSGALLTTYNTSTQQAVSQAQPCYAAGDIAWNFEEVEPGVHRYLCGAGVHVSSSNTFDPATGVVLSNTTLSSTAYWSYVGHPIVNRQTGLYCLTVWPPQCLFPNGTLVTLANPHTFDANPHQYFFGTTYVLVVSSDTFFYDAATGTYLSAVTVPNGNDEEAVSVAFTDDLVVLTQFSPMHMAYAVSVVNITQRALTSWVLLGQSAASRQGPTAKPAAALRWRQSVEQPLRVVVAIPVVDEATMVFSLKVWEVSAATTIPPSSTTADGDLPQVDLLTTIPLVSKTVKTVRGMECMPVGNFLSCSLWAGVSGSTQNSTTHEDAASTLVSIDTLSAVSNLTNGSVFSVYTAGHAGDMLVVAGSESGPLHSIRRMPPSGVAAFNATTGAALWHGPYVLIGPLVAYDALHGCVVLLADDGVTCIGPRGRTTTTTTTDSKPLL